LEVGDWRFIFFAMLPARREKSAFATTAIFSRFPNKNLENATLAGKRFLNNKATKKQWSEDGTDAEAWLHIRLP